MASACESDTARSAVTSSPSSTIPKSAPTTTAANANCGRPPPIARSPAASAPSGVPTCSQLFAPSSVPPHVTASTPIRLSASPYKANPCSPGVEQIPLKARRNDYESQVLVRLAEALPAEVRVRIVADRGFGDRKLYRVLTEELKFDFVIRFRGNIMVTAADGEARAAADWVGAGGRARVLRGATVTAAGYEVGAVVCVQAKGMKEPWCLAVSTVAEPARALINLYAKRWGIECAFRDTKDLRFGMGMSAMHISTPDRRDRLWLINAFAVVLLTLLGAAGEALGYDRHLKSNTAKRRTHSVFRQGCMLYELIPNMPAIRLRPLIKQFGLMLAGKPVFAEIFGAV